MIFVTIVVTASFFNPMKKSSLILFPISCFILLTLFSSIFKSKELLTKEPRPDKGTIRGLRVDMGVLEYDALLHLPLIAGAVGASALHLTTDPDQLVRLPDTEHQLPEPVVQQPQPVSDPLEPVAMPETQEMSAAHSEDSQFQRPGMDSSLDRKSVV